MKSLQTNRPKKVQHKFILRYQVTYQAIRKTASNRQWETKWNIYPDTLKDTQLISTTFSQFQFLNVRYALWGGYTPHTQTRLRWLSKCLVYPQTTVASNSLQIMFLKNTEICRQVRITNNSTGSGNPRIKTLSPCGPCTRHGASIGELAYPGVTRK